MSEFNKKQLNTQLALGNTYQVLKTLKDNLDHEFIDSKGYADEVISLANQWSELENKLTKGVLTPENERVEKNIIVTRLAELIEKKFRRIRSAGKSGL